MAFLDEVLVRVDEETRQVDVGRMFLTILAALLYAVGWLAGKTVTLLIRAVVWSVAAVRVGWADARRDRPRRA